jgi:integrase
LFIFLAEGQIGGSDPWKFAESNGEPINPNRFVDNEFKSAVERVGIGHLYLHDLRHSYGSLKIEQGENLKYIQTQMGHFSIRSPLTLTDIC